MCRNLFRSIYYSNRRSLLTAKRSEWISWLQFRNEEIDEKFQHDDEEEKLHNLESAQLNARWLFMLRLSR